MELLWVASAVLLVVVAPVVILLLTRLVRQVNKINRQADDVLTHAGGIATQLEAVPKLVRTRELVGVARGGVGQYGAALLEVVQA
jgi:hypothetical protein